MEENNNDLGRKCDSRNTKYTWVLIYQFGNIFNGDLLP